MMNQYLDVNPEVSAALAAGKPVVALESTIISHGMPYPQNVETALSVEKIIRENGATPATIAIIGGRLKVGLTPEEIDYLGKTGTAVTKASRRDLAVLVSKGMDGATTVTTTMMIAAMAGIKVFATGGIGGVHRGAETTMDISADLEELANTPVVVVPSLLQPPLRPEGGLPDGYGRRMREGLPCPADDRNEGRHAGDQSDPGGIRHGRHRDQQGHRRCHR